MKLLDYFIETLSVVCILTGVFVFFYQVGNFINLVARLVGVNLW